MSTGAALDQRIHLDARIRTVRSMIASYTLTIANHEEQARYAKRKLAEYQHEEASLLRRQHELAPT